MSARPLLTFELTEEMDVLEIHGDREGVENLIAALQRSLDQHDHQHLMTPAWGGDELSEERQGVRNLLLNHVKIVTW